MKIVLYFCILFFMAAHLLAREGQYQNFESLKARLNTLSKENPEIVALETAGTTLAGREIYLLELGSGKRDAKPAVMLLAGVDGSDLAGTEIIMRFVDHLLAGYGKVDSLTKLMDQRTFYIFPRVNPDATEALFTKPVYIRKLNERPTDLDADGRINEDGPDDLNKDGLISWMRITEKGGAWIEDSEHPGLMRKAEAREGEIGAYNLLSEGIDNDKDGLVNEDESGGVNFNRNFSYNYKYFQFGSGPHQISEMESRAVADFAFTHQNISALFSFSPEDNLINPWEPSKQGKTKEGEDRKPLTSVDQTDAPYYSHISEVFRKIYQPGDLPEGESVFGAFSTWAYYHFGRWSFSTPAWVPPAVNAMPPPSSSAEADSGSGTTEQEAKKDAKSEAKKNYEQRLWTWLMASGQESQILAWQEIQHPDYPDKRVEIGGFNPFAFANPPVDSLDKACKNFQSFMIKLSTYLPQLDRGDIKVSHLQDNIYRLTLVVQNNGFLASNPKAGASNKWSPKIKVALILNDTQEIISGRTLNFIDFLPGSGGIKEFNWLVRGKPGEEVKLSIGSPSTGEIVRTVILKQ